MYEMHTKKCKDKDWYKTKCKNVGLPKLAEMGNRSPHYLANCLNKMPNWEIILKKNGKMLIGDMGLKLADYEIGTISHWSR